MTIFRNKIFDHLISQIYWVQVWKLSSITKDYVEMKHMYMSQHSHGVVEISCLISYSYKIIALTYPLNSNMDDSYRYQHLALDSAPM